MLKITIFLMNFLFSNWLFAQSFSSGDQFTAYGYVGNADVYCQEQTGRIQTFTETCREDSLAPYNYDYFTSGEKIDADKVTLTSTDEDGRSVTKSQKYDAQKDRSAKAFNLWVISLTQKPLLNFGKNKVAYVFTQKSSKVKSGEITVEVKDGGVKRCRSQSLYYYNEFSCMNMSMQVCNDYFAQTRAIECF